MHPINRMLSRFGLLLSRTNRIPKEFRTTYKRRLAQLRENPGEFKISESLYYDIGLHPADYTVFECGFAASHVDRLNPKNILDIGSYRRFIIGMLSHFQVTTIDVRDRTPIMNNELVVTCDAKKLDLPDDEFDVVISLCALEHFGLGRYGDEYDLNADRKAFEEMIRVLKPGGHLIFTTTITRAQPSIVFNAHRIYSYQMLRAFCAKLECEEEKFYSHKVGDFCTLEDVTIGQNVWDVYCGCWKKK